MQRAIVWLTEMNDLAQHCKLVWSMSYKSNETSQWVCYFDLFMAKCFVSVLLFIVAAYLIFEKKNQTSGRGSIDRNLLYHWQHASIYHSFRCLFIDDPLLYRSTCSSIHFWYHLEDRPGAYMWHDLFIHRKKRSMQTWPRHTLLAAASMITRKHKLVWPTVHHAKCLQLLNQQRLHSARVILLADWRTDTAQPYDTPKCSCDGLPKSKKGNRNSANAFGIFF